MKNIIDTVINVPTKKCNICGKVFNPDEFDSQIREHLEIHDFLAKVKVNDKLSLRMSSPVYAMGHYDGESYQRVVGRIKKISKDNEGYDYLLFEYPNGEVELLDIWIIIRDDVPYINGKKWELDER